MNFRELSKALGLEKDEYVELLGLFVETSRTDLINIQTAVAASNLDKLARIAHSVKGAAVNLGLKDIHVIADEMEQTARNGHQKEIFHIIHRLEETLDDVAGFVTK